MKNILLTILICFFTLFVFSQAPQGMSYQAIAYNPTTNLPVTNQTISLRFSILDNSVTGAEVYQETFINPVKTITTNAQGVFSLNVGEGTPTPSNRFFSSISWGLNLKFLKVEIDVTGGTSFSTVGTNQLMSVPYALYSNATNPQNAIKIINTINDLRSTNGQEHQRVYIKCHTLPWDGGGGFFTLVSNTLLLNRFGNVKADDDGIIIVNPDIPNYRWVRDIQGDISVRFYGNVGNNDGSGIQAAIDYAAENVYTNYLTHGTTVFLPAREYKIFNPLIIKSGVSIKGESLRTTKLIAGYPDEINAPNTASNGGHMVVMDTGRIEGCKITDITFDGGIYPDSSTWNASQDNKTKGCMYFDAVSTLPYNDGGMWYCTFKNIAIKYFNGSGMIFIGGVTDFTNVNQCNTFENVTVSRQKDAAQSLALIGDIGQFTFINSAFGGYLYSNATKALKGMNCVINDNNSSLIGLSTNVTTFLNCTFQDSEYGVWIKHAEAITIDNCWFENLDIAISVSDSDVGKSSIVNILNSRFANSASFGSLPITNKHQNNQPQDYFGRCISTKRSYINVINNYVTVSTVNSTSSDKYFIIAENGNKAVNASGNSFLDPSLGKTIGITQSVTTVASNTIDVFGNKSVLLSIPTAQTINKINSTIMGGERLAVKVNTASVTFNNTGNIRLGTNASITVTNGKTLEFVKLDTPIGSYSDIYQLISVY